MIVLPACPCGAKEWSSARGTTSTHDSHCTYVCDACRRHGLYLTRKSTRAVAVFVTSRYAGDGIDEKFVEGLKQDMETYTLLDDERDVGMFEPREIPQEQTVFVRVTEDHWFQVSDSSPENSTVSFPMSRHTRPQKTG